MANGMKKLTIYKFQAETILDALRLTKRLLESDKKQSSMDRDIIQAYKMIENVLSEKIDQRVSRF